MSSRNVLGLCTLLIVLGLQTGCEQDDTVTITYRTLVTFNDFAKANGGIVQADELNSVFQVDTVANTGQDATSPITLCARSFSVEGNPYGQVPLAENALALGDAKANYFVPKDFCVTVQPGELRHFDQGNPFRLLIAHPYTLGEETANYPLQYTDTVSDRQVLLVRKEPQPFYIQTAAPADLPDPFTQHVGFFQTPETGGKVLAVWSDAEPFYCWVVDEGEKQAIAIQNGWYPSFIDTLPLGAITYNNRPGGENWRCPWPNGMIEIDGPVYLIHDATRTSFGLSCHLDTEEKVEAHGGRDLVWNSELPADQMNFQLASNFWGTCG